MCTLGYTPSEGIESHDALRAFRKEASVDAAAAESSNGPGDSRAHQIIATPLKAENPIEFYFACCLTSVDWNYRKLGNRYCCYIS